MPHVEATGEDTESPSSNGKARPVEDLVAGTADDARQTIERPPELVDTIRFLEELQEALGGRDQELVKCILDFTAETYALAQTSLEGGDDPEADAAVAASADEFLATLQKHLPPEQGEKIQPARIDLAKLQQRNLNNRPRFSAAPKNATKRKRPGLRPLLAVIGALGLAACDKPASQPGQGAPITTNQSPTADDLDKPPPKLMPLPPTTKEQVTEWFEGTWEKVTGGKGGHNSPSGSSKPFKLPVIPTALALIWALALATDKFKWDDRVLIGGSSIALIAKLIGSGISPSWWPDWLSPLQATLGPTWWWALEEAWVLASLKYLQDGPLKDRNGLHYLIGAGAWLALGLMNR